MPEPLSSIRTRVRRWVHEPTASESFFSDNLINNLINGSYRRRVAQLLMSAEGSFTQIAQRDLVTDQSTYAWPTGLIRLRRLDYVTEDGTQIPLERRERHTSALDPDGTTNTENPFHSFRPIENGFVLEPTPKVTITNGLRIEYQATPTELEADGDTIHVDFPDIFVELIVLDVVTYLMEEPYSGPEQSMNSIGLASLKPRSLRPRGYSPGLATGWITNGRA